MVIRKQRLIAAIVVAFYIAGILSAMHAALYTRTAQGAIAWSVALVSMPFVAVPAYAVLGRSKFDGMSDAFEARQDEIEGLVADFRDELTSWKASQSESPSWANAMTRLSNLRFLRGNDVTLLINGEATFDSILDGIARAEDYVLLQFYMIHDDGIGRRVKDALIERAAAGVKVIVLYDEIGSSDLPRSYVRELQAAGVKVSSFKPTQGWRNRFQLNFRNHRKMVVVDGREAWVGGHNIGDEYLGLDPDFSPWRDTHVHLKGPAALQVQLTILADWYWATRDIPELNWIPTDSGSTEVMVLPTGPVGDLETASLFFVSALSAARERIWLSAPYFVPDDAVVKALQLAALRGVDVRIITTGKPDSLPVFLAGFHYIQELSGLNIKFYAYEPGFLHEKVMLVDDSVSAVGTHNFDNRSFRLNFEVTAVIIDEDFASEMDAMFQADFASARRIDDTEWDSKPIWWRIAVRLSRLASPVL